jgi:hypothetical protein
MPTFVTVEFFDQSGDHILYVGEWVCRNGTTTFYLPAIVDLGVNFPFGYVGAAEIQSHAQIDYPGEEHDGEPIFAVVDVKKTKVYDEALPGWRHTIPGETQGGAYNAHPEHQKTDAYGWAMPYIAKEQGGVTSRIVIRNNANCNKIEGDIFIRDETGRVVAQIPVPWLHPKHMKVIDLAYFGQIARGFVGAATFEVDNVEQLCDDDWDGHTDNLPIMPSVVVLNYGYATELPIGSGAGPQTDEGDLTRIYEAIPFGYGGLVCVGDIFGTVVWFDYEAAEIDPEANEPLEDADVVDLGSFIADTTSAAGGYELEGVPEGWRLVSASKTGFWSWAELMYLDCGADTQLDILLVCEATLEGTVYDAATGVPLPGALVELDIESTTLDRTWDLETTTDVDGTWSLTVPLVGDDDADDGPWTLIISKDGYSTFVDAWEDDGDGIPEDGEENTAFADDNGFDSSDCIDPATESYTNDPVDLVSYAYVQGMTYCDGLVSANGTFDWGEEQPNVLVRLYDADEAGVGELFMEEQRSDEYGYYQFTVDLDPDGDLDIDESNDFRVVAHPAFATVLDLQADVHAVRNLDVCD